jgi:hypothetical protein
MGLFATPAGIVAEDAFGRLSRRTDDLIDTPCGRFASRRLAPGRIVKLVMGSGEFDGNDDADRASGARAACLILPGKLAAIGIDGHTDVPADHRLDGLACHGRDIVSHVGHEFSSATAATMTANAAGL